MLNFCVTIFVKKSCWCNLQQEATLPLRQQGVSFMLSSHHNTHKNSRCLIAVNHWMAANRLKRNAEKTELLWAGSRVFAAELATTVRL